MTHKIEFDILDAAGDRRATAEGRDAWALQELLAAGSKGCTPIDNPAPRWSGYIHKLRRAGVDIETVHEQHDGPFAGRHARYVLRSTIRVVRRQSEVMK